MTQEKTPRGYRRVTLWRDGAPRHHKVHVLVAAAFIGPRPQGATVDHQDEDKSNNAEWNLRYLPRLANFLEYVQARRMADMRRWEMAARAAVAREISAFASLSVAA